VAEQDRQPESLGKAAQFLIKLRQVPKLVPLVNEPSEEMLTVPLVRPEPSHASLRSGRRSAGDGVEPTGNGVSPSDQMRFAREHQKRRLCSIFGFMKVSHNPAANPQDHGPVALDKRRERRLGDFVGTTGEAIEKLSVRKPRRGALTEQGLHVLQNVWRKVYRQRRPPISVWSSLYS
jgi:hypothetical protein